MDRLARLKYATARVAHLCGLTSHPSEFPYVPVKVKNAPAFTISFNSCRVKAPSQTDSAYSAERYRESCGGDTMAGMERR